MSPALRTIGVALCGALLAAGCGDSDDAADRDSAALGSPDVQTSTREADCQDWNAASVEDRQVIVASIAEFEGGAPTGTAGRTLPDDEAYDLFERACEPEYAGAFKLYKIYVRAAAFSESGP
ncbi:MAG TPA: hypothetical protein VK920_12645 [Solirubrobacterales bacterium]|nr:hypothetical protein [Solirubrobacterales bacterium]